MLRRHDHIQPVVWAVVHNRRHYEFIIHFLFKQTLHKKRIDLNRTSFIASISIVIK